jgi:hypothetical protein
MFWDFVAGRPMRIGVDFDHIEQGPLRRQRGHNILDSNGRDRACGRGKRGIPAELLRLKGLIDRGLGATAAFWHRLDGVFAAWGARVRPAKSRAGADLWQRRR